MSTQEVYGPTQLVSLQVSNFRCFRSLSVDFHPELTVLTAGNGGGKTALLDAVAKGLAVFVLAAEREKLYTKLYPGDVHRQFFADLSTWESRTPTRIDLIWSKESTAIGTSLVLETRGSTEAQYPSNDALRLIGDQANQKIGERSCILPLIAYYGTERLWGEKDIQQRSQEHLDARSRLFGYGNCLVPTSGYHFFEQWFEHRWLEVRNGDERPLPALEVVKVAVQSCLKDAGWGRIDWDPVENTLRVEHLGRGWFPIAYTSDGITNIVGLVADIAHRCARLNPQFGAEAAQKTPGIVLIDEVDMHLHPEWQQTILASLREAFPLVQFIVTTHSPQVLSTVKAENIRMLSIGDDGVAEVRQPDRETQGVGSASVMAQVQDVSQVPPLAITKDLSHYKALIQQGLAESPEGVELQTRLNAHYGPDHPLMQECIRLLHFQAFKVRLPRKDGA